MPFDDRRYGSQLQFNEGITTTIAENKNQQQQINQSILQALDGYTPILPTAYAYHYDSSNTVVDRFAGSDAVGNAGHEVYRLNAKYNMTVYGNQTWYNGDLYFADASNHCIRRIRMSSDGYSETWCGTAGVAGNRVGAHRTDCELDTPTDIKFKSDGTAIICDYGNKYIRTVNASTGIITNVMGDGTTSNPPADGSDAYGNANGGVIAIAVGEDNVIMCVAYTVHAVFKIETNGKVYKMAGTYGSSGNTGDSAAATSCTLNLPVGIAYSRYDRWWYIADGTNARTRVVKPDGNIYAFTAALYYGMMVYPYSQNGNDFQDLFVGTHTTSTLLRFKNGSTTSSNTGFNGAGFTGDGGLASVALIGNANGICFDGQYNIIIKDTTNSVFRIVRTGIGVKTVRLGGDTYNGGDYYYLRWLPYR